MVKIEVKTTRNAYGVFEGIRVVTECNDIDNALLIKKIMENDRNKPPRKKTKVELEIELEDTRRQGESMIRLGKALLSKDDSEIEEAMIEFKTVNRLWR